MSDPGGSERISAECGKVTVLEARRSEASRRIDLFVAVLPATGSPVVEDPLFLLAGGPGQSATREFPRLLALFGRINVRRDLVILDQRGTGRSHPLDCPRHNGSQDEPTAALAQRLRGCRDKLEADPRYYGTAQAIEDLDAVRAALGYEKLNLYGGSYGTRVALAYASAYPSRLRSMVLDGVVPSGIPLGPRLAFDAQRALDGIFARCNADPGCHDAFPDLAGDLRNLLDRLTQPVAVAVVHPVTGDPTTVTMSRRTAAGSIRMLSYTSETATLLPLLIHEGSKGNLAPLMAQSYLVEQSLALQEGMHFSVICSEDFPYFGTLDDRGTYLEGMLGHDYAAACSVWPHEPSEQFRVPIKSAAPTLLLSGEFDPVTPPSNAELAQASLSQARHLVLPGEAHGVFYRGCTAQLVANFLDRLNPKELDASCLAGHRPLPFFTSFKGPKP